MTYMEKKGPGRVERPVEYNNVLHLYDTRCVKGDDVTGKTVL